MPDAYSISVPAPLVFVLHGGFGWGAQAEAAYSMKHLMNASLFVMSASSGWDQTAGPDGAVLVYPDGVNNTWYEREKRETEKERRERRERVVTVATTVAFPLANLGPATGTEAHVLAHASSRLFLILPSGCGYAKSLNVDDVGFIRSLLDRLTTELCLDTTKIFSTGMSNGAIMSHRLGCEVTLPPALCSAASFSFCFREAATSVR